MKKLIAVLALTLGAVACAKGTVPGAKPGSSNGTASPTAPTVTSVATATTQVTIYYLVSAPARLYLAPERHRVAKTQAIARAALEELVHGKAQDPDHTTPYPKSATINSLTIKDKVATVDWSAAVLEANVGSEAEALGIQSVVYTLTEFPSIAKVRFTVEGKDRGTASNGRAIEDWWGHVGLDGQPFDRDPAIDVLEPVTLWTPLNGASSNGTLKLAGEASTFEATVGIILRDATDHVVVHTSAIASIAAPQRGAYSKTIAFTPPATPQTWTLEAFESSAKDGSVVQIETRAVRVG